MKLKLKESAASYVFIDISDDVEAMEMQFDDAGVQCSDCSFLKCYGITNICDVGDHIDLEYIAEMVAVSTVVGVSAVVAGIDLGIDDIAEQFIGKFDSIEDFGMKFAFINSENSLLPEAIKFFDFTEYVLSMPEKYVFDEGYNFFFHSK
ncbi:MAG: hypothetical protein R8M45_03765 [Ghiorsea sp.]